MEGEQEQALTQTAVVTTPTVEELQAKLKVEQDARSQAEANWKNTQRLISKREQELKDVEERLRDKEAQETANKALIALLAKQRNVSTEEIEQEVSEKQPDLVAEYNKLQDTLKVESLKRKVAEYQRKTDALIKPDDERYELIESLVKTGKFKRADELLTKIEAEKSNITSKEEKEIKPVAKETEKPKLELDEEAEKEIALKYMKKKGILDTGSPRPSGGGELSEEQMLKKRYPSMYGKTK